jgi:ribosomal protein S18 acetylase RimI-like enzyme
MIQEFTFKLDEEIERLIVYTKIQNGHVGYLNYWLKNGSLEIADVLLDSKYRQKGIGSELIRRVILLANSKKCKSIYLGTAENDLPVHNFYRKHGFHLTGVKDGGASFLLELES